MLFWSNSQWPVLFNSFWFVKLNSNLVKKGLRNNFRNLFRIFKNFKQENRIYLYTFFSLFLYNTRVVNTAYAFKKFKNVYNLPNYLTYKKQGFQALAWFQQDMAKIDNDVPFILNRVATNFFEKGFMRAFVTFRQEIIAQAILEDKGTFWIPNKRYKHIRRYRVNNLFNKVKEILLANVLIASEWGGLKISSIKKPKGRKKKKRARKPEPTPTRYVVFRKFSIFKRLLATSLFSTDLSPSIREYTTEFIPGKHLELVIIAAPYWQLQFNRRWRKIKKNILSNPRKSVYASTLWNNFMESFYPKAIWYKRLFDTSLGFIPSLENVVDRGVVKTRQACLVFTKLFYDYHLSVAEKLEVNNKIFQTEYYSDISNIPLDHKFMKSFFKTRELARQLEEEAWWYKAIQADDSLKKLKARIKKNFPLGIQPSDFPNKKEFFLKTQSLLEGASLLDTLFNGSEEPVFIKALRLKYFLAKGLPLYNKLIDFEKEKVIKAFNPGWKPQHVNRFIDKKNMGFIGPKPHDYGESPWKNLAGLPILFIEDLPRDFFEPKALKVPEQLPKVTSPYTFLRKVENSFLGQAVQNSIRFLSNFFSFTKSLLSKSWEFIKKHLPTKIQQKLTRLAVSDQVPQVIVIPGYEDFPLEVWQDVQEVTEFSYDFSDGEGQSIVLPSIVRVSKNTELIQLSEFTKTCFDATQGIPSAFFDEYEFRPNQIGALLGQTAPVGFIELKKSTERDPKYLRESKEFFFHFRDFIVFTEAQINSGDLLEDIFQVKLEDTRFPRGTKYAFTNITHYTADSYTIPTIKGILPQGKLSKALYLPEIAPLPSLYTDPCTIPKVTYPTLSLYEIIPPIKQGLLFLKTKLVEKTKALLRSKIMKKEKVLPQFPEYINKLNQKAPRVPSGKLGYITAKILDLPKGIEILIKAFNYKGSTEILSVQDIITYIKRIDIQLWIIKEVINIKASRIEWACTTGFLNKAQNFTDFKGLEVSIESTYPQEFRTAEQQEAIDIFWEKLHEPIYIILYPHQNHYILAENIPKLSDDICILKHAKKQLERISSLSVLHNPPNFTSLLNSLEISLISMPEIKSASRLITHLKVCEDLAEGRLQRYVDSRKALLDLVAFRVAQLERQIPALQATILSIDIGSAPRRLLPMDIKDHLLNRLKETTKDYPDLEENLKDLELLQIRGITKGQRLWQHLLTELLNELVPKVAIRKILGLKTLNFKSQELIQHYQKKIVYFRLFQLIQIEYNLLYQNIKAYYNMLYSIEQDSKVSREGLELYPGALMDKIIQIEYPYPEVWKKLPFFEYYKGLLLENCFKDLKPLHPSVWKEHSRLKSTNP